MNLGPASPIFSRMSKIPQAVINELIWQPEATERDRKALLTAGAISQNFTNATSIWHGSSIAYFGGFGANGSTYPTLKFAQFTASGTERIYFFFSKCEPFVRGRLFAHVVPRRAEKLLLPAKR